MEHELFAIFKEFVGLSSGFVLEDPTNAVFIKWIAG